MIDGLDSFVKNRLLECLLELIDFSILVGSSLDQDAFPPRSIRVFRDIQEVTHVHNPEAGNLAYIVLLSVAVFPLRRLNAMLSGIAGDNSSGQAAQADALLQSGGSERHVSCRAIRQ